jgi:DNA-binding MarR family transcriptional regulator
MTPRKAAPDATGQHLSTVDGLTQLSFLILGTLERRAAEHDLSVVQTRLLGILRDRQPTMNELAGLLGLDKSSTSGLVDRAERRGLVQRAPSSHDGRAVLVTTTPAGRALIAEVAGQYELDVAKLLTALPVADRTALSGLISRLVTAHAAERQ